MSIVIPPGYMNLVISGSFDGSERPWAMSCGYSIEAFDTSDVSDIAQNIEDSDWLGNASSDLNVSEVDAVIGTSDPSAPVHYTAGVSGAGGGGAGTSPNVAYLVRKSTLAGGRKGRGRTYFPGVTEASLGDGGTVIEGDGSLRAGLEGFWNDITSGVESITGIYLLHGSEFSPSEITGWSLDGRVATQRRRLRK